MLFRTDAQYQGRSVEAFLLIMTVSLHLSFHLLPVLWE